MLNILGIGSALTGTDAGSTPSELGFSAASQALSRAGLTTADVSLIIGDCSTPVEKTPSEGQRVGKQLDIKVPAFDLPVGTSALVHHLSVLDSWKAERVPNVVLSVSTNTAYSEGSHGQPLKFSNGASAFVVSAALPGKLRLVDSYSVTRPEFASAFSVATFGGISVDPHFLADTYPRFLDELVGRAIEKNRLDVAKVSLVLSVGSAESLERIGESYKIPESGRWYRDSLRFGDCLGASAGMILANHWDEISPDTIVIVATAGMGMTYGYAVVRGS